MGVCFFMFESKKGLTEKIITFGILSALSLSSVGCGCKMQVGCPIPKLLSRDNPSYSIVKAQYDSAMDKARFLRAEGYRIDRLASPSNE